jgi:vacuolar-type H+-ATPase subunit E/Vma4
VAYNLALSRCKEGDVAAVESAIPQAVSNFLKNHGKPGAHCDVTVDKKHYLKGAHLDGMEYAGGVVCMSARGHMWVDNTFNARLQIASEIVLPDLKSKLFGSHVVLSHKINAGSK